MTGKPNVGRSRNSGASSANSKVSDEQDDAVEGDVYELLESVQQELEDVKDELKANKKEISALYSRQDKDRKKLSEFMEEVDRISDEGLEDDETESSDGTDAVDVAKVLEEAGLDLNDPKIKVLGARKYKNPDELYLAIGKHLATSKQTNLNSAQEPSKPVKKGEVANSEDMVAELNGLYRNPTGHEARIDELETALEWK